MDITDQQKDEATEAIQKIFGEDVDMILILCDTDDRVRVFGTMSADDSTGILCQSLKALGYPHVLTLPVD